MTLDEMIVICEEGSRATWNGRPTQGALEHRQLAEWLKDYKRLLGAIDAIKALGNDIRICQKSITDKKVLIGFNMAVALCNKHLAESEVQDAGSN